MKLSLPLIAAFVGVLGLSACGGTTSTPAAVVDTSQPTALIKTDTVLGTGADVVNGKSITVAYTGWLYSATATNFKGTQFDTSVGRTPASYTFVLGAGKVIQGWDQGLLGMKVGGKRTLIIPASLGYGTTGSPPSIPANAGLVFDVEVLSET